MKKIILASACLLISACSNNAILSKADTANDEAAIRKVIKDTALGQSAKQMAASFAEDAEWIVVGHAPYKGRADIEKGIATFMTPTSKLVFTSVETKDVIMFNDHQAFATTVAVYHVESNGKEQPSKKNEFADYFVKSADGSWKIAYEINSDDNG